MTPKPLSKPISQVISEIMFPGNQSQDRMERLESRLGGVLLVLGHVAEGYEGVSTTVGEIKGDVKELRSDFNTFQIKTASHDERIENLEDFRERHDTIKLQEAESARNKAEGFLETQRKEKEARRNKILAIIGTGVASFLVGLLLAAVKSFGH